MPRPRREIPNFDELVERYVNGEPANKLARDAGCSDKLIIKRLKEAGIPIRLRWSYSQNMEPCWAGRRAANERGKPIARKIRRAQTRERVQTTVSPHEVRMAAALDSVGLPYIQQRAFGIYNVDFTLEPLPIIVEVIGGGYKASTRAKRPERIKYLLDLGWHVADIRIAKQTHQRHLPMIGAAEYLVAFAQEVGSEPPAVGQYRVIRSDGQPGGSRAPYLNHGAAVEAPVSRADAA